MKKSKEVRIEDLAVMINKGFNGMSGVMNKQFGEVGKQIGEINKKLDILEIGQEDIKLRLTNVAYRFEVEELERRLIILEKKAGIVRR